MEGNTEIVEHQIERKKGRGGREGMNKGREKRKNGIPEKESKRKRN